MRLLVFSIIMQSAFILSASANPNERETYKNFRDYIDKIENLDLPFKFGCNLWSVDITEKLIASVDTTYAPKWQFPYKKVERTSEFVIVLYFTPADPFIPEIRTFDYTGKEISKLNLSRNCGQSPGFRDMTTIEISADFKINRTDSTLTWDLDDRHQKIESTKKVEVSETFYEIDDLGVIVEKK